MGGCQSAHTTEIARIQRRSRGTLSLARCACMVEAPSGPGASRAITGFVVGLVWRWLSLLLADLLFFLSSSQCHSQCRFKINSKITWIYILDFTGSLGIAGAVAFSGQPKIFFNFSGSRTRYTYLYWTVFISFPQPPFHLHLLQCLNTDGTHGHTAVILLPKPPIFGMRRCTQNSSIP